MSSPKISVIVPSYNKVKYIKKTLDSIFDQKYENLEVIVQDGGSTDGTLEIIKKYNVILESSVNGDGGQLNAVNIGFGKATGDILTFINADDYYDSSTFSKVSVSYIENPDRLWFAGKGRVVNEKNIEIAKPVTLYKNFLLSLYTHSSLLITNFLIQPSVFFTKEAYKKYGPFTGTSKFIMEYDFWLRLSKLQMPVIINHVLSNFRIEGSTKTMTMFNEILEEDEKIVSKYTKNKLILFIHKLHNLARKVVGRFV